MNKAPFSHKAVSPAPIIEDLFENSWSVSIDCPGYLGHCLELPRLLWFSNVDWINKSQ